MTIIDTDIISLTPPTLDDKKSLGIDLSESLFGKKEKHISIFFFHVSLILLYFRLRFIIKRCKRQLNRDQQHERQQRFII
jgi:hypothetical protein